MGKPLYENIKSAERGKSDNYQTPAYALEPLLPHIPIWWTIWECAAGEGEMAKNISSHGFRILQTDAHTDTRRMDFLAGHMSFPWDCIITNPPYSLKDKFIERCYELGKPWALLMKITALEGKKRQSMYRKHGLQMIFMDKRINYITPHGGNSGAWFASAWFTWGLNLPNDIMWHEFTKIQ